MTLENSCTPKKSRKDTSASGFRRGHYRNQSEVSLSKAIRPDCNYLNHELSNGSWFPAQSKSGIQVAHCRVNLVHTCVIASIKSPGHPFTQLSLRWRDIVPYHLRPRHTVGVSVGAVYYTSTLQNPSGSGRQPLKTTKIPYTFPSSASEAILISGGFACFHCSLNSFGSFTITTCAPNPFTILRSGVSPDAFPPFFVCVTELRVQARRTKTECSHLVASCFGKVSRVRANRPILLTTSGSFRQRSISLTIADPTTAASA